METFSQKDIDRMNLVPYAESLFTFRYNGLDWNHLSQFISKEEYQKLPWIEYGEKAAQERYYNVQYERMWTLMCRHQDYIQIWEEYQPRMKELKSLLESGQQELLRTELADYDRMVRYYKGSKLDFFVNRELNDIYAANRRYFDDVGLANRLESKAENIEYWPF